MINTTQDMIAKHENLYARHRGALEKEPLDIGRITLSLSILLGQVRLILLALPKELSRGRVIAIYSRYSNMEEALPQIVEETQRTTSLHGRAVQLHDNIYSLLNRCHSAIQHLQIEHRELLPYL
jgi:hypothetical protein